MDTPKGPAQSVYDELVRTRQPYLDRALDNAKYSIPALLVEEWATGSTELYTPWQSIIARCVNNLSNKLLLTLFPPTRRNFRLVLGAQAEGEADPEERKQIETALSRVEELVWKTIESSGIRPQLHGAITQLIIAGNALLYVPRKKKEKGRLFPMTNYVVRRKPTGEVVEIVIKEKIRIADLPESFREEVQFASKDNADKTQDIYTHVYWDGQWKVYQEVRGLRVPDSEGSFGQKNPYLALRWRRADGEDWARGHCDDYRGDMLLTEGLSKAVAQWAAMAAKVVFLVNPNSMTRAKALTDAENGEFVLGDRDDIGVLGLEKYPDFQVVSKTLDDVMARLGFAFLLNSAVQRDAERVTAEEISFLARELEDTLGGVYSLQSEEFQLALVELYMSRMERDGDLPPLPKDTIQPTIVTGIDALGRSHELAQLDVWLAGAIQVSPEAAMRYIDFNAVLRERAIGLGLDPQRLLKSEQQIAAEDQQAQQQQMVEKLGPNLVNAASKQMEQVSPNG